MERSGRDTGGSHCAEILLRGDSRHGQVHEVGRPAVDWDRGEDLMSSDWEKARDGGTSGGGSEVSTTGRGELGLGSGSLNSRNWGLSGQGHSWLVGGRDHVLTVRPGDVVRQLVNCDQVSPHSERPPGGWRGRRMRSDDVKASGRHGGQGPGWGRPNIYIHKTL